MAWCKYSPYARQHNCGAVEMFGICNTPPLVSDISSICLLFQTIILRGEVVYATESMHVLRASFA